MLEVYLQVRSFAATFSTQIYQTRAVSTSGRHFLFNEDCDRSKDPEKYRLSQKKGDLKRHDHNSSEIHQKGKKLVCFGKFSLYAAG